MKYKSTLDMIHLREIRSAADMKTTAMESSQLSVRAKALLLKRALDLILASLILIVFSPLLLRNDAGTKISDGTMFKAVELFYRIILCPQTMLFILPLLIVLDNILNWQIVIFSYIVVGFYAGLAILWLSLCLWKRA